MKKYLASLFVLSSIFSANKGYSQLYSQANVVVNLSGTTPTANWVSAGVPLFVGYGQTTPGNSDFNLMMASPTSNARGVLGMKKARGTLAAPAAVATNDQLGSLLVSGYDGTNFQGSAAVDFFADGTPTAGNVPARISFVTGTNSSTRAERLKIGNSGDITMNTNQVFLQRSTGRMGLGTLTPGGQLELSLDQARKPTTSTWTITSDARLKNIDGDYKKGLEDILKLKPITYHYKNVGDRKFDETTLNTQAYGFAAQDVQKVFPEAVGTDADGYLNLNIHPILIASISAIKELKGQLDTKDLTITKQQTQIEKQQQQLNAQQAQINQLLQKFSQLESRQELCCTASQAKGINQNETMSEVERASLEQNAPNPVNNTTVIKYRLPSTVRNAQLTITDAKGVVIKTMNLNAKSIGQVTLSAGTLATGTYFYTLITDGKKVETKEMQIVK